MTAPGKPTIPPLPSLPPWAQQLANILPLSALIDFLDIPKVFHIYQLRGGVPLWCWPITPSASRLLLGVLHTPEACLLDRHEGVTKPLCLDGLYGDQYPHANAETLRMALQAVPLMRLTNDHPNVEAESNRRPQYLEIVSVGRSGSQGASGAVATGPKQAQLKAFTRQAIAMFGWSKGSDGFLHNAAVAFGWLLWALLLACTGVLGLWIAFDFLLAVAFSGFCVTLAHGSGPRYLGERSPSVYNRLVVSASNVNSTKWTAYYGESSVVNALLNWPILPRQPTRSSSAVRLLLRVAILCQWALAIAAAAEASWSGCIVAFWILFCVLNITYVFCSDGAVLEWMTRRAGITLERHGVTLSSRRALLNTLIALNPDTFAEGREKDSLGHSLYSPGGLSWLDPILKDGADRDCWLEATRRSLCSIPSTKPAQSQLHLEYGQHYWWKFVGEGNAVTKEMRSKTSLGRRYTQQGNLSLRKARPVVPVAVV